MALQQRNKMKPINLTNKERGGFVWGDDIRSADADTRRSRHSLDFPHARDVTLWQRGKTWRLETKT
jgi:hypothetical protein